MTVTQGLGGSGRVRTLSYDALGVEVRGGAEITKVLLDARSRVIVDPALGSVTQPRYVSG